jgi:DNA-binding CsgD family transcriptional regulator
VQAVPFVGRDEQLAALRACFDDAAGARTRLVVLEGDPGVGKTRLLSEALVAAQTGRWDVLVGAAHEFDPRPLAPLTEALDLDVHAALDPSIADEAGAWRDRSAVSFTDAQLRAMDACIAAVEVRSRTTPIVLAIEDVQWADAATLATLRALARGLAYDRVVIVVTARLWPRTPELHRLVDDFVAAGATRVVLTPLDAADATARAATAVGADAVGPNLLGQLGATGGNPFFLTQLVAALAAEGAIDVSGGVAEVGAVQLPASVQDTVLRRLASLPDDVLEVLQGAALLGPSFDPNDLAVALGRPAGELVRPLAEARAFGLLGDDGERLAFGHALVRDAIYTDLPLAVRRALHAGVGRALAAANAPPERVAQHLAIGAEPGDAEAVEWLRLGARRLLYGNPAGAAELLDRAVEIAGPGEADHVELMVESVEALLTVGRFDEGRARAEQLLAAEPDAEMQARVRLAVGEWLWVLGEAHAAHREYEAVTELDGVDARTVARVQGAAAFASLFCFEIPRAIREADDAIRIGRACHERTAVVQALGVKTLTAIWRVDFGAAVAIGEEAIAAAGDDPDALWRAPHVTCGLALLGADRLDEGDRVIRTGLRILEELGALGSLSSCYTALVRSGYVRGAWDDALAAVETVRALRDDTGMAAGIGDALAESGLIHLHRGDLALARAALDELRAELARLGLSFSFWSQWLKALIAERDGDPERATRLLADVTDGTAAFGVSLHVLRFGPDLVRVAIAAGDHDRARATADALVDVEARANTPSARGAARLCRGLVDRDPQACTDSIPEYRASGRRSELVVACEGAAEVLAGAGRRDEAVATLHEALEVAEALGAAHHVRLVGARLRELGAAPGARARRQRVATGWDSLTPTEREVADLVAEGLTNKEVAERMFISYRTVTTHLTRTFNKLGLRSRTQLAAELVRRAG